MIRKDEIADIMPVILGVITAYVVMLKGGILFDILDLLLSQEVPSPKASVESLYLYIPV
jgi:hypothetical protein